MRLFTLLFAFTLAACAAAPDDATAVTSEDLSAPLQLTREHVAGDVYHYIALVRVGSEPNAVLRIHRVVREIAPFVPRRTAHAVMMLHGDFSTFDTSFLPGLAPYLAARDIDVWGLDRRWTIPGTSDDISDFGTMGVEQELDDTTRALAIARAARGGGRLALLGFSHGAQLAYTYASVEAARPAALRSVDALVALDFYGAVGPDAPDVQAGACANAAFEYDEVAQGVTDFPNDFLIATGQLAASAPDDPSPLIDGMTNRDVMLFVVGQTYQFAPYAPLYHLLAPVITDGAVTGLRDTSEAAANAWLAGATPHQATLESADLDALLCGDGSAPIDAPLSRITVPLDYIGAAGGVGTLGLYSTTQVSSTDVTTSVVTRRADVAQDFGHVDLAFADDAPALVWRPLATWLAHH